MSRESLEGNLYRNEKIPRNFFRPRKRSHLFKDTPYFNIFLTPQNSSLRMRKPEHYWNHRIITKWCNGLPGSEGARLFSIVEVHYDKGKPVSYADKGMLNSHASIKDLKWTMKKLKKVFKKSVLDADNNLKKWKKNKR